MNKLLQKVAKILLGLSMAAGVGVAVSAGHKDASPVRGAAGDSPIIIDATNLGLTSTATTSDTTKTYGGVSYVLSSGAKLQSSSGSNKFSTDTILIGKSGTYIYNSTAIPGEITKFEVYANKGASAKVSVGVKFSASAALTSWSETGAWTQTLSTLDHVYDASSAIVSGAKYFRYQVTNANNSQIAFRITYKTLSSIALSGTYPTTFNQDDSFSHSGMTVTATYSDSSTADVTSSATFSGYNMSTTGNQTVTVSYIEGGVIKTATYSITVNAPTTPIITPAKASTSGYTGTNESLSFTYANVDNLSITSSDTSVVTVGTPSTSSGSGTVQINFVGAGSTTVKFKDGSTELASVSVSVTAASVSITGLAATSSVYIGKTLNLGSTITVTATGNYSSDVTWESDDNSIATVSASGVVTGVADGTVDITVISDDYPSATMTCAVTVSVAPLETTYDFVANFSTYAASWNGYSSQTLSGKGNLEGDYAATVTLPYASKQTGTITTMPVVADQTSGDVVHISFELTEVGYELGDVSVTFAQWASKTPTMKLFKGTEASGTELDSGAIGTKNTLSSTNVGGKTFVVAMNDNSTSRTQVGIESITITLVAQAVVTYKVTYDDNGADSGNVPTDNTNYSSGAEVTVLGNTGNLLKTGYTFGGWNTADDGTGTPYAAGATFNISDNTTLYAVWAVDLTTYSVTYYGNTSTGGTVPTDGNSYSSGAEVTVLGNTGSLVKTGYMFNGWNTAADGTGTGYAAGSTFTITANVDLYAQWLDNSGGVLLSWSRSDTTDTYTAGYIFSGSSHATSKSGYYQDGGSDGATRGVALYSASSPILSTAPNIVTISATLGGGTAPQDLSNSVYACYVDNSGEIIANTSVVLTSAISNTNGSEFTANLSASGITTAYGVMVYHVKESGYNVRYFGFSVSFSNQATYTVTYDGNGGTGSVSDPHSPYVSGTTVTVLANAFTKDGYTFQHWSTATDGTGVDYDPDDTFSISANTTLYAIWAVTPTPIATAKRCYSLVTSTDGLVAGAKYIIAASTGTADHAMSTTQNSNNRAGGEITISNSVASVSSDGVQVVTLEGTTGAWNLAVSGGYLYAASSTANHLKTESSVDQNGNANWAISFSNGIASIIAQGTYSHNVMQYNAGSSLFACYSSDSQTDVSLYRLDFGETLLGNITCDGSGSHTFPTGWTWNTDLQGVYNDLPSSEKTALASASSAGLARYDYIVGKYNPTGSTDSTQTDYVHFITGRTVTPLNNSRILLGVIMGDNANTVAIIVIISMVSVTAIGGYFFLRKRKENN